MHTASSSSSLNRIGSDSHNLKQGAMCMDLEREGRWTYLMDLPVKCVLLADER
eukprot:COSAG06_NODE_1819_length_8293_cov_39.705394_5_plen_53_part_00